MNKKPPAPIPFYILTGFLGAGKTTLLNRWLKSPDLSDALVLVNEFGDIALDHLLVETATEGVVLLPSGCVCCAVRGDLVAALENLLRKRDNNRIAPFSRVILETTGLADPAPVLAAILNHPYLKLRFDVRSIITVVDAVNGLDSLSRQPEAAQQAVLADLLLLSKTDIAGEGQAAALADALRALNPLAAIMPARDCDVHALLAQVRPVAPIVHEQIVHDQIVHGQPVPPQAAHGGISHFTLTSDMPVRAESFDLFLDLLRAQKGADLLRVKGLLALDDDPDAPLVIHAVQHILHPVQRLPRWPDDDRRSRLVFIVRHIAPDFVASLWDALNGDHTATIVPPRA